jgi:hypothetical protein
VGVGVRAFREEAHVLERELAYLVGVRVRVRVGVRGRAGVRVGVGIGVGVGVRVRVRVRVRIRVSSRKVAASVPTWLGLGFSVPTL